MSCYDSAGAPLWSTPLRTLRFLQKALPESFALRLSRLFVRLGFAGRNCANLAYIANSVRLRGAGKCSFFGGYYIHDNVEIRSDAVLVVQDGARINVGAVITSGGDNGYVDIGKRAYIGPYCVLHSASTLVIGANVLIGPHCGIFAETHGMEAALPFNAQPVRGLGITIGENVWIGSGVSILDGVTIGTGSVVGAGAVVRQSFPPQSLIAGSPAKLIRSLRSGQQP